MEAGFSQIQSHINSGLDYWNGGIVDGGLDSFGSWSLADLCYTLCVVGLPDLKVIDCY